MSVFLVTWNPKIWIVDDEDWAVQVQMVSSGRTYEEPWSIGGRKGGVHPGDTFLLVRVGKDRGIVASGTALSTAYTNLHWDEKRARKKDLANYVLIEWDVQVEIENRLRTEDLLQDFPEVAWNNLQSSGVRVADQVADELVERWLSHTGNQVEIFPDETPTFIEGGSKLVLVNRYERNAAARRQCLQIHGTSCAVCGFDGEKKYGGVGAGLIHVHHHVEVSTSKSKYEVDPEKDLVPVCPNCHAMIHRRRPAYSISEVQKMVRK